MKKNIVSRIIALEFLVIFLIPIWSFNFDQGKVSTVENRNLTSFPAITDSEGKISQTLSNDLKVWFEDNLGFREELISLSHRIQYSIFHQSPSEKVELGKDGWLYYTVENNLKIASGTYPNFDESVLEGICKQQIEISEKLAKQGMEYVVILPPSKVSIYPEYIESGDYSVRKTPVDMLADYLEAHSEIKVVRLKDTLLEEKEKNDELLYFKTDTHWNMYGRYIGYKKIISDLNEWSIMDADAVDVKFTNTGKTTGDLSNMIGNTSERYQEEFLDYMIESPTAYRLTEGERYEGFCDQVQRMNAISGEIYWNTNESLPKLLVFGDSNIGQCLMPLLAENASELSFVWSYKLEQNMIDYIKPNVVILEISERHLDSLFNSEVGFLAKNIELDTENKLLDVYYYDNYQYENMWFPVWSEEKGQDDLVWYQAKREENGGWHITIDLTQHNTNGNYQIHFYSGVESPVAIVDTTSIDIGSLF